jgi:deazaflavin-dependent oxidoreductase (nitroreductase family)
MGADAVRPLAGDCDTSRMPSDRTLSRFSMSLPDSVLRSVGKLNVPLYRASRGRLFATWGRAPVLLLTSTGRRSGEQRTAPVVYMTDGDRIVVIGSNAGNERAPAWALNLQANPSCAVQLGGRHRQVNARVAEGEERAELWRKMNEQYAGFDDYDERTSRDIPVFVLESS